MRERYVKIFKENLKLSAAKLGLGRDLAFQHDNDPKHASLLVKKYLQKTTVNITHRPAQSILLKICVVNRRPRFILEGL